MIAEPGKHDPTKVIIAWANEFLSSHGYQLKNNIPEIVQNTPWSYVARFVTSDGYIYLKYTPDQLALEAQVIHFLREQFHAPVADVIKNNEKLKCFLMRDAGSSLRSLLKQKFDEALLFKAIDQFTALQIKVADHVHQIINIGVPDWRIEKFPALYQELLTHKDFLIEDGLSENDFRKLETLLPRVADLSKQLSRYAIQQTIVQPDFNDNNMLFNQETQAFTIIDLGEIAISHPFFSILNMMFQIKKHHTPTGDAYLRIQDACLKNFLKYEPKENLLKALAVADLLSPIYGALSAYRLKTACDPSRFIDAFKLQGRPSLALKEFIDKSV